MKKQSNRKYPLGLFIFGMFTNSFLLLLFSLFFLLLLFILKLFFKQIPMYIPFIFLIIWFIKALFMQLKLRQTALEKSDNEEFNKTMDSWFDRENMQDWKQKVINTVNDKIKDIKSE